MSHLKTKLGSLTEPYHVFLGKVTFDPVILCFFRQQNHLQSEFTGSVHKKNLTSKRDTQRQ